MTSNPRLKPEIACRQCMDTGMIAIRARDGMYAFPGPVPDDARGYADADCWYCDCARKPETIGAAAAKQGSGMEEK